VTGAQYSPYLKDLDQVKPSFSADPFDRSLPFFLQD